MSDSSWYPEGNGLETCGEHHDLKLNPGIMFVIKLISYVLYKQLI